MTAASIHDVDHTPVADPLLRSVPLPYEVVLPVLGIAVRFRTNSRYVLACVRETFVAPADGANSRAHLACVRIVVRAGEEPGTPAPHGHAPIRHICPDEMRVIAHSAGSVAVSDPSRREAVLYVTTALAADREHFREAMLRAMTLCLLAHFDRHPMHAAAVAAHGRAILLAGPSGSGKSTLAYVAHRAGLELLGDDLVWVQLEPTLAVWTAPSGVRLLPQAASAFPELAGVAPTWARGKEKLDVTLGARAADAPVRQVTVCLLQRGVTSARLERLGAGALADALLRRVDPGFDRFPRRHAAVVEALSARGGWLLSLSGEPREALPLLQRMLDDADGASVAGANDRSTEGADGAER